MKDISNAIKRSKSFYSKKEPGHILVNVNIKQNLPEAPSFTTFELDSELEKLMQIELDTAKLGWKLKENVEDDSIPSISPYFGIAEHSAWLGLDVVMQKNTSLPIPVVKQLEDLNKLSCCESNKWFQYMDRAYKYLRSQKNGSFNLSVRGVMTPMDLTNAICGDKLFEDLILEPEFCHQIMDYCVEAIRWYYPKVLSWSDCIEGGYIFNMGGMWMPEGSIGHLSNDAAMLCSPKIYKKFGFPYEKELTEGYSNILYHVHNEKIHYLNDLVKLPNLSMLQITYDPKTEKPINNLEVILTNTGKANLMLDGTCDEIVNNIDLLKERNIFLNVECDNVNEAKEIVKFIRSESKEL